VLHDASSAALQRAAQRAAARANAARTATARCRAAAADSARRDVALRRRCCRCLRCCSRQQRLRCCSPRCLRCLPAPMLLPPRHDGSAVAPLFSFRCLCCRHLMFSILYHARLSMLLASRLLDATPPYAAARHAATPLRHYFRRELIFHICCLRQLSAFATPAISMPRRATPFSSRLSA